MRSRLRRVLLVALAAMVLCFCFKEQLFAIVFYPKGANIHLINIQITQQFLVHMRVALWMGIVVVSPYVLYELFAFVAPGLYQTERRLAVRAVGSGYLLFLAGVALNYFVIFPFSFRFLVNYQVYSEGVNQISLSSYISTVVMLSLLMGLLFEIPIVNYFLAKMGLLTAETLKKYRRHAIVVILILGAIITPTGDPITLSIVSVPIYLLWDLSLLIVKRVEK